MALNTIDLEFELLDDLLHKLADTSKDSKLSITANIWKGQDDKYHGRMVYVINSLVDVTGAYSVTVDNETFSVAEDLEFFERGDHWLKFDPAQIMNEIAHITTLPKEDKYLLGIAINVYHRDIRELHIWRSGEYSPPLTA